MLSYRTSQKIKTQINYRTHLLDGGAKLYGLVRNSIDCSGVFYSSLLLYAQFQAGLDVMLSVPRRANDAMYVNMLQGYDVSSLRIN